MTTQQLKQVQIVDYLHTLGIEPIRSVGNELVYHSPKTNENTPSFFVNTTKNVFCDYSGDERGDIIRLVQHIRGCDFPSACNELKTFKSDESYIFQKSSDFSFSGKPEDKGISISLVRRLEAKSLIAYAQGRGISFEIAYQYLKQVHYQCKGKNYQSIGFQNDKGGYELRSEFFKGAIAPKFITTIEIPNSTEVYVFEGFFDFLSAMMYFNVSQPRHTTIVLNSTACLPQALERLSRATKIHSFLDIDASGEKTFHKISDKFTTATDRSNIYEGFNDFNDFLTNKQNSK